MERGLGCAVAYIIQYGATDEEVRDALKALGVSADANEFGEFDGCDARLIFSFLASVASVARQAHSSQHELICVQA